MRASPGIYYAGIKVATDHAYKISMLDRCRRAPKEMKIRVVVSDHAGRTLFESDRYLQKLCVEVYDSCGHVIFSSREYFSERSKQLLVTKKTVKERIRHNVTEKDKEFHHECTLGDNSVDVIRELLGKNNIVKFHNGDITNSEKSSTANIQNGDITNSEKSSIANIQNGDVNNRKKDIIANIQNGNLTDSQKNKIASIQIGDVKVSEKNSIANIQKGDITNNENNKITDLEQRNITHGKNTANKIIVQEFPRQAFEESSLKHEIKDFVSGDDVESVNKSVDYRQETNADVSLTLSKTEPNSHSEDQVKHVRNKTKAGTQSLLSETDVKQSARSEDPLKCDICGVLYKSDIMLNKHKQMHEIECTDSTNPLQCSLCKKVYPNWKSLTIHKRKHSAAKDQVCEKCGKGFRSRQELIRHEFVHTKAKASPCHICGKLFKNKAYAQMHSKLHSEENRKHICTLCGKHFLRAPDIQKHMRIHTGEKPFICSHCGRSFCESSHLIRHERLHTGEKPYRCDKCDLTFTHKEVLLRHSFTHVKFLPFSCAVCLKGFKTKRELNHHCLTHEKPREPTVKETCKVCGQIFNHSLHFHYHQCSQDVNRLQLPFSSEVFNKPSHSKQQTVCKHEVVALPLESGDGLSAKAVSEVISFEVSRVDDPMSSNSHGIVNEHCIDMSVELNHLLL